MQFFLVSTDFLLTILDKNFQGFDDTNVSPMFHYEGNVCAEKKASEIITFYPCVKCDLYNILKLWYKLSENITSIL